MPAEVRAVLAFFKLSISLGLDGIPLACLGANDFYWQLLYWMLAPLLAFAAALLTVYARIGFVAASTRFRKTNGQMNHDGEANNRISHFERIMPIVLRIAFLSYPIVTSFAFEAFSCHVFDEGAGAWLVAGVRLA